MDEAPEIDRVANELSNLREQDESEPASAVQLDAWLKTLIARGGSDLLLVAGAPACIRAKGFVQKIETRPLDGPVQLISRGHIDREDALLCAIHPDDLDIFLKTGSRG
jgi:hypothetical protein